MAKDAASIIRRVVDAGQAQAILDALEREGFLLVQTKLNPNDAKFAGLLAIMAVCAMAYWIQEFGKYFGWWSGIS